MISHLSNHQVINTRLYQTYTCINNINRTRRNLTIINMSNTTSGPTLDPRATALPSNGPTLDVVAETNTPASPSEELSDEEWASQFDISDLDLSSPARNENEILNSLVPPPALHNARARKSAAAKKRQHNGNKGEECSEYFW